MSSGSMSRNFGLSGEPVAHHRQRRQRPLANDHGMDEFDGDMAASD